MTDPHGTRAFRSAADSARPRASVARCLIAACLLIACGCTEKSGGSSGKETAGIDPDQDIHAFCSACHRLPPPDVIPRANWRKTIESMYSIYGDRVVPTDVTPPPLERAVEYFTSRAPEKLPAIISTADQAPGPVDFRPVPRKISTLPPYPGVSDVKMVHLLDDRNVELLLCEMRFSQVFLMQPSVSMDRVFSLGNVLHPARAEVADLDADGIRDVLVASLGTVTPSDVRNGAVVWLRGLPGQKFQRIPLVEGLGRVADARAADLDGDGDQDVVAGVFGWRRVGRIVWLENQGSKDGAARFELREIDPRPGASDVPVTDLNGDGLPDFVALISQQYETVVAFINLGDAVFNPQTLFIADHPNWGSSGIELVDLDQDGDQDVLYSNGDSLDDLLMKNYHGVQWLENKGDLRFESHRLTDLFGAHSARAGDFDGDGDKDIVVGAFLPFLRATTPGVERVESLVWLEQTSPGRFERHPLETVTCFHPTIDVGDLDGDGKDDFVVGNLTMARKDGDDLENWITIWANLGSRETKAQR